MLAGLPARDVPPSEVSLSELLSDFVSVTHRITRLAAQATGNQESQAVWRTLSVLLSMGPMRLGELASQSRVSQPTMTKIVKNLVETGWLDRIADPLDARAWQIRLAPAGADALNAWRTDLGDALTPIFADLTPEDRRVLERAVEIMHERLVVGPRD
ncbi:MarR family transcriptional regulator [Rathayibacter sp. AY1G1]|nr:MarR family transcriptional regulator [Rathayibacter sp. AY1A4]PPF24216.1 MarR family transcriptional regulator [Rathayibacter sp. AY1F2]PPF28618.1 MarR family transcriptional regulator [Rathayibacter sp. AY1A3]PPG02108.1 MarR family transcriptional regulator [Rathayibacter sp. AY2B1]PPG27457.1 MarR family transcriptional regulator [Rathayibacter sp. AY2B9]PPG56055.1 MarR family transcriptional regulator [Rathayibacter sp. AY2B7]PPG56894.1 MarR family transcriptional regulator [Rathayibact